MIICAIANKVLSEYTELIEALKLEGKSVRITFWLFLRGFTVKRTVRNLRRLYNE